MKETFAILNQMHADGVIGRYAIGGAVGATFYLEPVATLDVDVFVKFLPSNSVLVSLSPIYEYLLQRGYRAEGEYIVIGDWPVQFLPPASGLEEEAIAEAIVSDVQGVPVNVMSAEHLTAIALSTGRSKDFARILQFVESGAVGVGRLDQILIRHGLLEKWQRFAQRFLNTDSP